MFAVSTALRDFTRPEAPPSLDAFAREVRDLGADGVTIAPGVPGACLREFLDVFSAAACPVLAIGAPNPRPPEFDRNPETLARLSAADLEPQGRKLAERAWLRTLETAAEAHVPVVVLRLGRVEAGPGEPLIETVLADEVVGSRRADAWVREALTARAQRSAPHFDAVRRTLDAVLPAAERLGISVALAMPTTLAEIPTYRELETLVDELSGAPVGVWFDSDAAFALEALNLKAASAWIERFGPMILGGDLVDARKLDERVQRGLRPGEGEIDFVALRKSLGDALGDRFARGIYTWSIGEGDPGLTRESISHLRRSGWLR